MRIHEGDAGSIPADGKIFSYILIYLRIIPPPSKLKTFLFLLCLPFLYNEGSTNCKKLSIVLLLIWVRNGLRIVFFITLWLNCSGWKLQKDYLNSHYEAENCDLTKEKSYKGGSKITRYFEVINCSVWNSRVHWEHICQQLVKVNKPLFHIQQRVHFEIIWS